MNNSLYVSGNSHSLTNATIKNLTRLAFEETPKKVFFFGYQETTLSSIKKNAEALIGIMTKFIDKGTQVFFINGAEYYPFYYKKFFADSQVQCFNKADTIETENEIFVIWPIAAALFPPEIVLERKNKKVILLSTTSVTNPLNAKIFKTLDPFWVIQNTSDESETTKLKEDTFNNRKIYEPATSGSFIELSVY